MNKKFYLLIGLLFYWFIPAPMALAAGEFQADYDVAYAVTVTGKTIVTQDVTLTNQKSNLYPKEYKIVIDSEKITNVIARDDLGTITPKTENKDGKTEITLTFNSVATGIGKRLTFTLRYENADIVQKNGNIWEIYIPGVKDDPDIARYSVSLQIPPQFGPNAYISPLPDDGNKWTKEQMKRGGISAAYGKEQYFILRLRYDLENTKVTPVYTEIALPPNTPYQTITIKSLNPRPTTVRRDADGNWLARYDLAPRQKLSVHGDFISTITLFPKKGTKEQINENDYLKPLEFWDSGDKKVIELAQKLKTPRTIYDYVTHTLSYDYDRVTSNPQRKGAAKALVSPRESVCTEFTDAFIALARAAGIPAREAVGYAYTTNSKLRPLSLVADVLHAWPEYYDRERQIWIPVDPTWGSTTGGANYFDKMDFNHIVFALHGLNSSNPYPAGYYRLSQNPQKSVQVGFLEAPPVPIAGEFAASINFPKSIIAGLPAHGGVTLENTSGIAIEEATITVKTSPFSFVLFEREKDIPPFMKKTYPINIKVPNSFTPTTGIIEATINEQHLSQTFHIRPFYEFLIPLGVASGTLLLLIIWLVKRLLWTPKRF